MRALYLSTRLAGTDGVSLEAGKLAKVLASLGFATYYCAGELDAAGPPGTVIPELHFRDAVAQELGLKAFSGSEPDTSLARDLAERASFLKARLAPVFADYRPDLLVLQNVWAIPMQLPLAQALAELVLEHQLPTLSHEHDYAWERERFSVSRIPGYLATYFPFHSPTVRHLCINSLAQHELQRRRGLVATVIPNIFDFATPAPGLDTFNVDFRRAIGLSDGQRLILQPTRVVPRKGIELAINLLAELADPRNVLVITHRAGDEGLDYLRQLERYAAERQVALHYVAEQIDEYRSQAGEKRYALWDTYPHADFVTYPSLIEGFGNALLETIYFKRPALVNRYPVYLADIAPKGFRFVEIDGYITPAAVQAVAEILENPQHGAQMAEHNYRLAAAHYSYQALRELITPELQALGWKL